MSHWRPAECFSYFSGRISWIFCSRLICRHQSDHAERSDLAKRFFIARWERERAKGGEGRGLKYPSVKLSMIWLVRILWFMLIGGWGRRRNSI
jgi:hypothetical protein